MQEFKLDEHYTVVCESQNRRGGFRHVAVLLYDGYEVDRAKICYQNRTWERFQFQSVLQKLIHSHFVAEAGDSEHADKFLAIINK